MFDFYKKKYIVRCFFDSYPIGDNVCQLRLRGNVIFSDSIQDNRLEIIVKIPYTDEHPTCNLHSS